MSRSVEDIMKDLREAYTKGGYIDKLQSELLCYFLKDCPLDELESIMTARREGRLIVQKDCTWSMSDEDDDIWVCLECSLEWSLIDGDPFENDMEYCPKCGSKITKIMMRKYDFGKWEYIGVIKCKAEAAQEAQR